MSRRETRRADDARVAEIVGWRNLAAVDPAMAQYLGSGRRWVDPEGEFHQIVPDFTCEARWDREILRWAGNNLSFSQRRSFMVELQDILSGDTGYAIAWPDALWFYKAGDYSRALLAMEEKGLL